MLTQKQKLILAKANIEDVVNKGADFLAKECTLEELTDMLKELISSFAYSTDSVMVANAIQIHEQKLLKVKK